MSGPEVHSGGVRPLDGTEQSGAKANYPAVNANDFFNYVIEPLKRNVPNWSDYHTEVAASAATLGGTLKLMPEAPSQIVDIGSSLKIAAACLEGFANGVELVNQFRPGNDNISPWATLSGALGLVGMPLAGVGEEGPSTLDPKINWGLHISGTICVTLSRISKIAALVQAAKSSELARPAETGETLNENRMRAVGDLAALAGREELSSASAVSRNLRSYRIASRQAGDGNDRVAWTQGGFALNQSSPERFDWPGEVTSQCGFEMGSGEGAARLASGRGVRG
ncbi:hypothetical protein [Actinoplanes sp. NPDC048796]|uniref:hypothetical protein n=1 Tax=unclassified Actinoplanes TaxID=2626549 RepID=UPI00340AF621